MCLFYLYANAKIEIHNCSNKHETGLVLKFIVCVNKKAILSQFQDKMILFLSRSLKRNKHMI